MKRLVLKGSSRDERGSVFLETALQLAIIMVIVVPALTALVYGVRPATGWCPEPEGGLAESFEVAAAAVGGSVSTIVLNDCD